MTVLLSPLQGFGFELNCRQAGQHPLLVLERCRNEDFPTNNLIKQQGLCVQRVASPLYPRGKMIFGFYFITGENTFPQHSQKVTDAENAGRKSMRFPGLEKA